MDKYISVRKFYEKIEGSDFKDIVEMASKYPTLTAIALGFGAEGIIQNLPECITAKKVEDFMSGKVTPIENDTSTREAVAKEKEKPVEPEINTDNEAEEAEEIKEEKPKGKRGRPAKVVKEKEEIKEDKPKGKRGRPAKVAKEKEPEPIEEEEEEEIDEIIVDEDEEDTTDDEDDDWEI